MSTELDLMPPAEKTEPQVDHIDLGTVRLHPLRCEIVAELNFDQWQQALVNLSAIGETVNWCAGDLLVYGEDKFGEKYAQAVDSTGMSVSRLQQCAWVSRAIKPQDRVAGLTWTHHERVASLAKDKPDVMRQLLGQAKSESWTVARLKMAARENGAIDAQPLPSSTRTVTGDNKPAGDNPSLLGLEPGQGGGSQHFNYEDTKLQSVVEPEGDLVAWGEWSRVGTQSVIRNGEARLNTYELRKRVGAGGVPQFVVFMNGKEVKSFFSESSAYDKVLELAKKADKGSAK